MVSSRIGGIKFSSKDHRLIFHYEGITKHEMVVVLSKTILYYFLTLHGHFTIGIEQDKRIGDPEYNV